jgi:hypothetical protein
MKIASIKTTGIALTAMLMAGGAALAQGTEAQQDACRPDVFRLCSSYIPDVGEIVACLRSNESNLSTPCRDVMFAERTETERHARTSRDRTNWNQ